MEKVYGFTGSGGAAKGAWGAGVSHYLINDLKREYQFLSGTSTGALFLSFIALQDTVTLKEAYTTVTNNDIFTVAPYRKGRNGKVKMNFMKILWNILARRKKTFGDSSKLRDNLLPKFFKENDFKLINALNKECIVAVTNLTKAQTEYKSSKNETYEDFLDWTFASTCATPYMSMVKKDNCDYIDGGYIEHMPIQVLIDRGCTHIDVIDHAAPEFNIERVRNPFHLIYRSFELTMRENALMDLQMAKLNAKKKDVVINIYQPKNKLTDNSLFFEQDKMLKWWNEGYNFAKNVECQKYVLSPGQRIKKIIKQVK